MTRCMKKGKLQGRTSSASVSAAVLLIVFLLVARSTLRRPDGLSPRVRLSPRAARPFFVFKEQETTSAGRAAEKARINASLARVASLRRLFDQQRMASSAADAASPASAGLRAAAAVALDAESEPVFDELAAARMTATEATGAMIYRNQFPEECQNARLLLCSIDKDCGFACQLHHGVHLLALALATNRTLVLYAEEWRYGKHRGDVGRARGYGEVTDVGGEGARSSSLDIETNDRRRSNNDTSADDDFENEPNPNVWSRSHGIHTAAPASSWERVFARVTHCATGGDDWLATLPKLRRGQEHAEARAVVATVIDGEALPYDPPSVPRDVAQLVSRFHSRPEVWWVGALARYLLRPVQSSNANGSSTVEEHHEHRANRLSLHPGQYVGMHVRRTDKIKQTLNERGEWPAEAARHELDEYVEAAEMWHAEMSAAAAAIKARGDRLTGKTRARAATTTVTSRARAGLLASNLPSVSPDEHNQSQPPLAVYLATDDASLASQAPLLYPHIRWVTNPAGATDAAMNRRNSFASLLGVVDDLHFLSHADVVVGSFTSQVSRLAYELLQHEHAAADASLHYHSVDSQWYFGGGLPMRWCVRWWSGWAAFEEEAQFAVASEPKDNKIEALVTGDNVGSFAAGSDSLFGGNMARRRVDHHRSNGNRSQARPGGDVASSPAEKSDVLLCEADVTGVGGRVRCRSEEGGGARIDAPAAALERCHYSS